VEYAADNNCHRVMWQALDWNTPAIDFYTKKLGAVIMKEWVSLRLTKDGIEAFRQAHGINGRRAAVAAEETKVLIGNGTAFDSEDSMKTLA
jgi:hypothetical protein